MAFFPLNFQTGYDCKNIMAVFTRVVTRLSHNS